MIRVADRLAIVAMRKQLSYGTRFRLTFVIKKDNDKRIAFVIVFFYKRAGADSCFRLATLHIQFASQISCEAMLMLNS